jgi:adenylate cyclase
VLRQGAETLFGRRAVGRARALGARLAAAGTRGHPPDVQRRLKILNVIAYLIALTTAIYAFRQWNVDYDKLKPAILLNIAIVAAALLVPLAHRVNDVAGGLLLVGIEFVALQFFASFFGRDGGAQVNYILAAAAPFVVFGLKRIWLVLAVVVLGLVLHLRAWFAYHDPVVVVEQAVVDAGYTQAAITTVGLIAASIYYAFSLAEKAKAETDMLLRNILPDAIVERLKARPGEPIADSHAEASVLFADISGFVALAQRLGAAEVVRLLNRIVMAFDALAERNGVEKIKTIGDAYMAVAGLPEPAQDHTRRLAAMALDMQDTIARLNAETGLALSIRIGIASGPVMAGVIGAKKFSYDVWGDAVNLAARLEQQAAPGRILACPCCRRLLEGHFAFESRGLIDIKGLGPRETWYVERRQDGVAPPLQAVPE